MEENKDIIVLTYDREQIDYIELRKLVNTLMDNYSNDIIAIPRGIALNFVSTNLKKKKKENGNTILW